MDERWVLYETVDYDPTVWRTEITPLRSGEGRNEELRREALASDVTVVITVWQY
jgi:hypothetical protein